MKPECDELMDLRACHIPTLSLQHVWKSLIKDSFYLLFCLNDLRAKSLCLKNTLRLLPSLSSDSLRATPILSQKEISFPPLIFIGKRILLAPSFIRGRPQKQTSEKRSSGSPILICAAPARSLSAICPPKPPTIDCCASAASGPLNPYRRTISYF